MDSIPTQAETTHSSPADINASINANMDFFTDPPLSTSEEGSYLMKVSPVSSIQGNVNILYEFKVDAGQYADMHNCFHFLTVKIVKEDGTDITAPAAADAQLGDDHKVAFTNNIASSVFKDCELTLNGKLIESCNNMYAHKAFLQTFLSTGKDIKDNQLAIAGYHSDTGDVDSADNLNTMHQTACLNKGLKERFDIGKFSKPVHLIAPVFLDFCGQKRYLQNSTKAMIKFTLSDPNFALLAKSDAKGFKFIITEAYLLVRIVKPTSSLRLAVEETLEISPAKYPMKTYDMRYFTFAGQSTTISESRISSGQLPGRIIFGLVSADGYGGDYKKSPLKFEDFKVSEVSLRVGGVCVTNDPIRVDMANNNYLQPFFWMFRSTGGLFSNNEPIVNYGEFKQGHFIYVLDLLQDSQEGSEEFHPPKDGVISLDIRLTEAPGHPVTLVVMLEREAILTCDNRRQYTLLG